VNIPPALRQRVLDALDDELAHELVEFTCALVDIPSPTGEEGPIGDYLARRLRAAGLETRLQEVEPGRNNVIARRRGTGGGRSLLLNAHFDTSTTGKEPDLPAGHRPQAVVEGRWIRGLGVSNMKCAFPLYYGALRMLERAGVRLRGDVVVEGVVGEIEKGPVDQFQGAAYRGGGMGTAFACHHGVLCDYALDAEPTGLRIQPGNEGYVFARVTTHGVAQHTWSKENGVDAIAKAVDVLGAIRAWEPAYERRHAHPRMKTRIGVGAIQGGYPYKPSICPAPSCSLYLDIHTLPDQDLVAVRAELEAVLDELRRRDPELHVEAEFFLARGGYELPEGHPVTRAVEDAHRWVTGREPVYPEPYRYAVSADTSILYAYGVEGLTYGPGGITQDGRYSMYDDQGEILGIENLLTATRVYALASMELCGVAD
jgi:acetylornithine deacetylase/succinyl-diaminopimelate desuccinylase-like protein